VCGSCGPMDLSSLTEADVGKLRVVKLKAILADAGVDNKAKKAELVRGHVPIRLASVACRLVACSHHAKRRICGRTHRPSTHASLLLHR